VWVSCIQDVVSWLVMVIGLCFVGSSVGLEVVCVGSFGGVKLVMVIGISSSSCVARAGSSI